MKLLKPILVLGGLLVLTSSFWLLIDRPSDDAATARVSPGNDITDAAPAKLDDRLARMELEVAELAKELADLRLKVAMLSVKVALVPLASRSSSAPDVVRESAGLTSPSASAARDAASETGRVSCLAIADVASSVVRTTSGYVYVAWKIVVSNNCDRTLDVSATFKWFDANDFELDSARERTTLPPKQVSTITGQTMIEADVWQRAAKERASVDT